MSVEFKKFPKIPRWKELYCIITEKIDGTNAQITITEEGEVLVGSRSRYITPGKQTDNYGFAAWVEERKEELMKLGVGTHYGEWYGSKIQRKYGMTDGKRCLVMFNTSRPPETLPSCVKQVPVLYEGPLSDEKVEAVMMSLKENGSVLVPGFEKPEGIVINIPAVSYTAKLTFENSKGKWCNEG